MAAPDRARALADFITAGLCSNCHRLLAPGVYKEVAAALTVASIRLADPLDRSHEASMLRAVTAGMPAPDRDERAMQTLWSAVLLIAGAAIGFLLRGYVSFLGLAR